MANTESTSQSGRDYMPLALVLVIILAAIAASGCTGGDAMSPEVEPTGFCLLTAELVERDIEGVQFYIVDGPVSSESFSLDWLQERHRAIFYNNPSATVLVPAGEEVHLFVLAWNFEPIYVYNNGQPRIQVLHDWGVVEPKGPGISHNSLTEVQVSRRGSRYTKDWDFLGTVPEELFGRRSSTATVNVDVALPAVPGNGVFYVESMQQRSFSCSADGETTYASRKGVMLFRDSYLVESVAIPTMRITTTLYDEGEVAGLR